MEFFNELAELIGHDSRDVAAWLADHPNYDGRIWANNGDGGEDFEVTEIYYGEGEE